MASLKDQLLKAGLVDKKKARQADHEKRQQNAKKKKARKSDASADTVNQQELAAKAAQAKRERDQQLNRQREEEKRQKALVAEISQLIQQHKQDLDQKAETPFHYNRDGKITKIYVTGLQQSQLARRQLGIGFYEQRHFLIPTEIAERINQRIPGTVILMEKEEVDEDDPYADYQVPDDLIW